MESSKSYTIRTETGEIRLMTQEEVGALVRSTMEKARAMAPTSPVSPKNPVIKPVSPTSPYTSTSQRLSRSPRSAKKFQLRLSPRNGSAKPFYESSSSSLSPLKNTPKLKVTEDRTEKTTTRVISTEERFTAMVAEKNFTVHTQAAGRKNLSETEINDLVRNSIRRARENAKTKTPQQLEMSFQNTVMLNEVTASPVKRFSWSSPEPSVDDDDDDDESCQEQNKAKKSAANVEDSQENQSQDPCEISSIDGKPSIQIQEKSAVQGQISPRIDMRKVNQDSEVDVPPQQQKTPVHTNVSGARSPFSIGSANKTFRSFFGGVERTARPRNSSSYGRRRDTPINGTSSVVSPESSDIPNVSSQVAVALDTLAGFTTKPHPALNSDEGQLQSIPESPLRSTLTPIEGQRNVANGASSIPKFRTVKKKQLEIDVGSPGEEPSKTGGLVEATTAKASDVAATNDSVSVCPSESSRRSRLDVVVTSEDFGEMKKENGDGMVIGATRLEYTPGEASSVDEQEVSEMTDIVQLTMLRARQTAEAAQNSIPDPELEEFPLPNQRADISAASTPALPEAPVEAQSAAAPKALVESVTEEKSLPEVPDAVNSQQSEETTIVSNTFRDRLAAPDLQSDRVRRGGTLAMPIMHEDTEDESESGQPVKKLELPPRQEAAFSQPARSAMAFISATTERGAKRNPAPRIQQPSEEPAMQAEKTSDIDAGATKTVQSERNNNNNNNPAPDAPEDPEIIAVEDLGTSSSASELNLPNVAEERATETATVSGRLSRQLLSLKLSESSEGEFPIAKKVRESLSASLKTGGSVARFTARSPSDDSDDRHVLGSTSRRFRVRTNRRQRKGSVSSLTIDTDTVITAELIADLASRKGQTVTADELNKMILGSTNRGSKAETVDSGVMSPANADVHCTIQSKDQGIVMSLPMQFCVDFMDLIRVFDFRRTGDDEDHEDFISITGVETPMEESDEFEPLQEVAEETTTCDTDIDGVDTNPRMTFSFSVPDEDTSSSSTSMSSDEESSNVGW